MINVIGLGYIGLPTALMMAANGLEVVGTDYNPNIVRSLNDGIIPFQEEGITELFNQAKAHGIRFSSDYQSTDVYIVAVPDSLYQNVPRNWIRLMSFKPLKTCWIIVPKGQTIVIESTISPGTIDRHIRPILTERGLVIGPGYPFGSCPGTHHPR